MNNSTALASHLTRVRAGAAMSNPAGARDNKMMIQFILT